jgi:hypothetical protein
VRRILNAYKSYRVDAEWEVARWERNFNRLSPEHQQLLPSIPTKRAEARRCVYTNHFFLQCMLHALEGEIYGMYAEMAAVAAHKQQHMDMHAPEQLKPAQPPPPPPRAAPGGATDAQQQAMPEALQSQSQRQQQQQQAQDQEMPTHASGHDPRHPPQQSTAHQLTAGQQQEQLQHEHADDPEHPPQPGQQQHSGHHPAYQHEELPQLPITQPMDVDKVRGPQGCRQLRLEHACSTPATCKRYAQYMLHG